MTTLTTYWIGMVEEGFPQMLWRKVRFNELEAGVAHVDIPSIPQFECSAQALSNQQAAINLAKKLGGILHEGPRAPTNYDFNKEKDV